MTTMEIVPVRVSNWPDTEPVGVKKTTLKTYALSATQQICDYEPKRRRMSIQVYDLPVALTTESPVTSPDTSNETTAPQGLYLAPSEIPYEFYGPDAFWLNPLTIPNNEPVLSGVVDTNTATFAAAAGGSLFGPAAGESVAGFSVLFQAPAAAVNADITLTNVLGGTQTYRIVVPTTGLNFTMNYPKPVPAANSAVFPTVNVPAIVGGPAYSITLQSLKTIQAGRVTVVREFA